MAWCRQTTSHYLNLCNFPLASFCGIHLKAISHQAPQLFFCVRNLKNTLFKLLLYLPRANELNPKISIKLKLFHYFLSAMQATFAEATCGVLSQFAPKESKYERNFTFLVGRVWTQSYVFRGRMIHNGTHFYYRTARAARMHVVFVLHCFCYTYWIHMCIYTSGSLFIQRTDVLPANLVKSWCSEIGCYNGRIALTFDRHLGSRAAEALVNLQGDYKSVNSNLAGSILHEILR